MEVIQNRTVIDGEAQIENGMLVVVEKVRNMPSPREDGLFKIMQARGFHSDDAASLEDLAYGMKSRWPAGAGEFPWKTITGGREAEILDAVAECAEKTGAAAFPVYGASRGGRVEYSAEEFSSNLPGATGIAYVVRDELEERFGRRAVPSEDALLGMLRGELADFAAWKNGEVFSCSLYDSCDWDVKDGAVVLASGASPECSEIIYGRDKVQDFIEACTESNGPSM